MYSAVLMLALTAGSESADFGRNRCHGTTGCTAVACYPVGCTSSCHDRHHRRDNGCTSSYYGCSVNYGCSGGGLFSRARHHGCTATYGCTSTYGCTTVYGCTTGTVVPAKKDMKDMPKGEPVPVPKGKQESRSSAPATIIVNIPAGARLIVDGAPTSSTTERRTLITPNLEFGSTYVYTMRAEIVRDGQTVVETKEVTVRGGETSTVQFQFPQTVASR
jgi:uncharacterized protein (TIGR03000 family)